MANYTPNFNLMKPLGSENYNVSQQNGNMDKIDTSLQGLGNGLGIIANGNTHAAISSGEYVYVHGHGTLAEGLYQATANIAANGTLSSSNLSFKPNGIGGDVSALNSKITDLTWNTSSSGFTWCKNASGQIFAYKEHSQTSGTTKSAIYPNSYYSTQTISISDIPFTRSAIAYGDLFGSYPESLKLDVQVNWNRQNVLSTIFTDNPSTTFNGRIVLIGY